MTSKTIPTVPKPSPEKSAHKIRKGTSETSRLFIDVEEMIRHPQIPLSRYVE